METVNDVIKYAKYFSGKNESPPFYYEKIDCSHKLFVPIDNINCIVTNLSIPLKNIITHYFVADSKQNKLLVAMNRDKTIHEKVFATTSPDFSVDSVHCFSCFNISNILKARIIAYAWQSEYGLPVILTLQWGDETTYKFAFGNIEKQSIVALSSQGITNISIFKKGLCTAIDVIKPEAICWYGNIPMSISSYYDTYRIIKMQKRNEILSCTYKQASQPLFEFEGQD